MNYNSATKILEQLEKFQPPLLEFSSATTILEQLEKFQPPLLKFSSATTILKQLEKFQPTLLEFSSATTILEQLEKFQPTLLKFSSATTILEQLEKFQPTLLKFSSATTILEQLDKFQPMKLDNIFKVNSYYNQIDYCYEKLDNLCYESSMNYPENEIFFISIRKYIYNIKLYFLDQVGKLLDIESIDYRIWKPCLDRAIINSRDAIILFIHSLVTISIDMKSCLEKGYMFKSIFLLYVINIEFNKIIKNIKINLYKELEKLGIDLDK